jgi:NTE family protein
LETKLEIGSSPGISGEWYQPLGPTTPYFISPEVEFGRTRFPIFVNNDQVADYFREGGAGTLKFGRELGSLGETFFGISRGFGRVERDIGDPELPNRGYDIGAALAGFTIDTLDQPDFPTEGVKAGIGYQSSLEALGASQYLNQLVMNYTKPMTFGRNTLIIGASTGQSFQETSAINVFGLGGFLNISGYQRNAVTASDYYIIRTLGWRRVDEFGESLFGLGVYSGASFEFASIKNDSPLFADSNVYAGSVFIGMDTPLLPMYLAFGLNDEQQQAVYLTLGRLNPGR